MTWRQSSPAKTVAPIVNFYRTLLHLAERGVAEEVLQTYAAEGLDEGGPRARKHLADLLK